MDGTETADDVIEAGYDYAVAPAPEAANDHSLDSFEGINQTSSQGIKLEELRSAMSELTGGNPDGPQLREKYIKLSADLFAASELPESYRDDFTRAILAVVKDLEDKNLKASLPARPIRDFRPHRETIIDYIRSPEGFGPWLKAGVLSRPMIRKISLSSKPYEALANWMRTKPLPDDINIPKKSEVIAQELKDLYETGAMSEHKKMVNRQASRVNRAAIGR
jgi:hypothetical protein